MSIYSANFTEADSEADTCRKEVLPKLNDSGWVGDRIAQERYFTDGKITVAGRRGARGKRKRFDYLLRYSQNYPLAIVEAKKSYKAAGDGMQQAKDYAEILGLKFAYATNGKDILEFDFLTGAETPIDRYPTPDELWTRLNATNPISTEVQNILLKPFYPTPDKEARYYQRIAINTAVQAILEGRKQALLILATGTGKTSVAFQIIYKLWNNRWNVRGEHRRPKVLFIADRNDLITDPHSKDFAPFGNARCLVPDEGLLSSREIYFSTYQSLAEDENKVGAFRSLAPDFFDLIVIDECHRGSSSEDSNWRTILNYFENAVKLGLTATPVREDEKDTYAYFGNPLYTYSLRQGIEDGFLAPYIVHRVVSEVDAAGWRPQHGEVDANGVPIPDSVYLTPDFERVLSHLPRTKAVAKHLFDFMVNNGRYDKTIVFCHDQEHADHFRREFSNLNADIVRQYPDYVVRIVSDEGTVGKGHLHTFKDIDGAVPIVVTTSRLLSTGVDVPTCRNVVIFREVNSPTEFKQIIGRGTRVREDKEKLFFTILDYTGSATRQFADPGFDGYPPLITEEGIDANGNSTGTNVVDGDPSNLPPDNTATGGGDQPTGGGLGGTPRKKYFISEGEDVSIVSERVHVMGEDGRLRTAEYTVHTKEQITTLFPSSDDLRHGWMNEAERKRIIDMLAANSISLEQLAEITKQPSADPFDLLCFVAYDLKPLTRKQRAELLERNKPYFFAQYSEVARNVLHQILQKYVATGPSEIRPDIISVAPINKDFNSIEIVTAFGGYDAYTSAITQLQQLLYTT